MTRVFKADSGQPLEIQHAGGSAALTVETDGDIALTQDIYLAAGKGIYFDGGTTSANYLGGSDAYEEGVRVVTMSPSYSGDITVGSNNTLAYTKIGRICHVQGYLDVASVSSPVGSYVAIDTLPFTPINSTDSSGAAAGSIYMSGLSAALVTNAFVQIVEANARFYIYESDGQANDGGFPAQWTSSTNLYLQLTYACA